MTDEPTLSTWTIYDHPADFPDNYVLREFRIVAGQKPAVASDVRLFLTLGEARREVQRIAPGTFCMTRSPDDDPTIVETWI